MTFFHARLDQMAEKKDLWAVAELMSVCTVQTRSAASQNIKETIYQLLILEQKIIK